MAKKREAGDKTKGFTLQKHRAIALFFDELKKNPNAHISVATEYKGDVYIQNEKILKPYVEEQKNYDNSTSFSFNNGEILNTLAYFLEIWIKEGNSGNMKFGFYTTNKIGKEYSVGKAKKFNITLPDKPVIRLLIDKEYREPNLLDTIRKYLIGEYKEQYEGFDITKNLEGDLLLIFLNSISWFFEQDDEKKYEEINLQNIKDSKWGEQIKAYYGHDQVLASLMFSLEKKQDEEDLVRKFLTTTEVENIFLKVSQGSPINDKAYKYLNFDYSELISVLKEYLNLFLENKYYSNVQNKKMPQLLERNVAKHSRGIRLNRKILELNKKERVKKEEVIIGKIGNLINSDLPTFLFGEIGSGKSTLLAHYFHKAITEGSTPIFITSTYIRGKKVTSLEDFKSVINSFVNEELQLQSKFFELDLILKTQKELVLVLDGIDELDFVERKNVIRHLLSLSNKYINLRIVASGRPVELEGIVNFNQWNCLTTIDLGESEIRTILVNEAIVTNLSKKKAIADANKRLSILQGKQELYANVTTPLIVCLIRDFLVDGLELTTIGELFYKVVKKRLEWNLEDNKGSFEAFFQSFPNIFQREPFLAEIGYEIYKSRNRKVNEDRIYQVINSSTLIQEGLENRNQIVSQAIDYLKNAFLLKVGDEYTFASHQLMQFVVGLQIAQRITSGKAFVFDGRRIDSWREISYAGTISRIKGEGEKMEGFFSEVLSELFCSAQDTALAAVFLMEIQSLNLNYQYLKQLYNLGFRPLLLTGYDDTLVPQSYGYIFTSTGQDGFNWFFNHYLDPKHPSITGQEDVAVKILRNYLVQSNYQLESRIKSSLKSMLVPHIRAKTYTCDTLIPLLSLVMPEAFEVVDRCVLLAKELNNDIVHTRAEELLLVEWDRGENNNVLDGLEKSCSVKGGMKNRALTMWFQLSDRPLTKTMLDNSIVYISRGNDEIWEFLIKAVSKEKLFAYLKFCVINNSSIGDSAGVVLYTFFEEKDIELIGKPILYKTKWYDSINHDRVGVLRGLMSQNEEIGKQFVLKNMPNPDKEYGMSEFYTILLLQVLNSSTDLYLREYQTVVGDFGKNSLARFPEIREGLRNLLSREEYYQETVFMLRHIDAVAKYNAALILLNCFPKGKTKAEFKALEIVIRSAYKRFSDNNESLRLCMKICLGTKIREHIYIMLKDLPSISKLFALKLLFHNDKYKLDEGNIHELFTGLVGEAYFLDFSMSLEEDGVEVLRAMGSFFSFAKKKLLEGNLEEKREVASCLLSYHYSKLTMKEKALSWFYDVDGDGRMLVMFQRKHMNLLDDDEFVMALKGEFTTTDKKTLFQFFYEVIKEDGNWEKFLLNYILSKSSIDSYGLDEVYLLLISLEIKDVSIRMKIGAAVSSLMTYPVFKQNSDYNGIYPYFALLAHEFGGFSDDKIVEIVSSYRGAKNMVLAALFQRMSQVPADFVARRGYIQHICLFSENRQIQFVKVDVDEFSKALIDGDDIPKGFINMIETILIEGIFREEELLDISKKGNLALYFSIIVAFARNIQLGLNDYLTAKDIGSINYYTRESTELHNYILRRVKGVLLIDEVSKELYVQTLVEQIAIEKPEKVIDIFIELFKLGVNFTPSLLPKFIEALIQDSHKMELNIVYWVCNYVERCISSKDKDSLIIPLKQQLKATLYGGYERSPEDVILITWLLALLLIYLEGKTDEETSMGFLIGLKSIFMKEGGHSFRGEKTPVVFIGNDLLVSSRAIYEKIDKEVLRDIIKKGEESEELEISLLCRLLIALVMN
jgi:hypothetical protein